MNTSMLHSLPQDHFEILSLMATDYLAQHDGCVPCILIHHKSDAYQAFKSMCLASQSPLPIRWEIPPPTNTAAMGQWQQQCRFLFGHDNVWHAMEPCNSARVWNAIDTSCPPQDVYALLREHLVVILIR